MDNSSCAGNMKPEIPTTQLMGLRSKPECKGETLTQETIPDFKIVLHSHDQSQISTGWVGLTEQSHSAAMAARDLIEPPVQRKKHEDGTLRA